MTKKKEALKNAGKEKEKGLILEELNLDAEEVEQVTGGSGSIFDNVPRVPTNPIDSELRSKV